MERYMRDRDPLILIGGRDGSPERQEWVLKQLLSLKNIHIGTIVLVTASHRDFSQLERQVLLAGLTLKIVRSECQDETQILELLKAGVFELDREQELHGRGAYILPIEVPSPNSSTWEALDYASRGPVYACVPRWNGKVGYPLYLSSRILSQVRTMESVEFSEAWLLEQLGGLPGGTIAFVEVNDPKVCFRMPESPVRQSELTVPTFS